MVLVKDSKNLDFKQENPCTVGCVYAKRDQKNLLSLNAIASPGEYKIMIFYVDNAGDNFIFKQIGEIVQVSLYASFIPLVEKEDRVNCRAGVLPRHLDNDGLSYNGFIRYSDRIVADFSADVQMTTFRVKEESVLRIVTVQDAGLSVKVELRDFTHRVIKESVLNHESNSLVDVLDEGLYHITLSEAGSISEDTTNKFCETFLVDIGLSPRLALKEMTKLHSVCDDEAALNDILDSIPESLGKDGRFELLPDRVFSLGHPKDGHEIVYHANIEFSSMVYAYFEIFSDFVAHDLLILLTNKNDEVYHNYEHSYLQGSLKSGKYQIMVLLRSPIAGIKETDCVSFNLNIKIVNTSKKTLEKWKCTNYNTYSLPFSLNTLDKLGIKGTDQESLPVTVLFNKKMLAPNSELDIYDKTRFVVERESVVKVMTDSLDGMMKLVLRSSDQVITSHEPETRTYPLVFALSAVVQPGIEYEVQVFYYPRDTKICHTYTMLLEIYPNVAEQCEVREPDQSVIIHRTVDSVHFNFVDDTGLSPDLPKFSFARSKKAYSKTIELEIIDEFAMVSGYLISNNYGLTFEIFRETALVEWGKFQASHRYQLRSTKLYKGKYLIVIKDLFTSKVGECVEFSLAILVESYTFSKNNVNLMRKTETCIFPDPPYTLNFAGLLDTGKAHVHQKINANFYKHYISIEIKEKSVLRVFIQAKEFRDLTLTLKVKGSQSEIISNKVKGPSDGLHAVIEKGTYRLEITNEKSAALPEGCDFLEFDVEVMTEKEVKTLSKQYDCKSSSKLSELTYMQDICIIYDSSDPDNSASFSITESEEISVYLSYANILSGYLSIVLSSPTESEISRSLGGENIAQLKARLEPGTYQLDLVASTSPSIPSGCWPLSISLSLSSNPDSCSFSPLPSRLISTYGGPQQADGSVTFRGRFRSGSNPDVLFIEIPKNSIMRLTAVSKYPELFIEFTVYRDNKLKDKVGYSQGTLNKVSLILNLNALATGYYVVVSYISQSSKDCLTFDMKVQVETMSTVRKLLQCSTAPQASLLPKSRFDFSSKPEKYEKDDSVMLGSWIRGSVALPAAAKAADLTLNYSVEITLSDKGIISASILHDFLTSLYVIKLYSDADLLSTSSWELDLDVQADSRFNFATSLPGEVLDPGKYTLVIKTGVSNKLLLSKFADTSLCFPFAFELEFVPFDFTKNQLVQVYPESVQDHQLQEALTLRITFRDPVEFPSFFLSSKAEEHIYPSKIKQTERSDMIIAEFTSKNFVPGSCYKLMLIEENFETSGLSHEYCMAGCDCNAIGFTACLADMKCICENPYTGAKCFECVDGYTMDNGYCLSNDGSFKSYLVFAFVYSAIGLTVVYLVSLLRKRARMESEGLELRNRREGEGEIDLYSN